MTQLSNPGHTLIVGIRSKYVKADGHIFPVVYAGKSADEANECIAKRGDCGVIDTADDGSIIVAKTEPLKLRWLACACCGSDAGHWAQWFNQDTGYGICRRCVDWSRSPERAKHWEGEENFERTYGVAGIHYEPSSPEAQGHPRCDQGEDANMTGHPEVRKDS